MNNLSAYFHPQLSASSSNSHFIDIIHSHDLYQLNGVRNPMNHYLDLVLANRLAAACCSVAPATSLFVPADNHHPPLEITIAVLLVFIVLRVHLRLVVIVLTSGVPTIVSSILSFLMLTGLFFLTVHQSMSLFCVSITLSLLLFVPVAQFYIPLLILLGLIGPYAI